MVIFTKLLLKDPNQLGLIFQKKKTKPSTNQSNIIRITNYCHFPQLFSHLFLSSNNCKHKLTTTILHDVDTLDIPSRKQKNDPLTFSMKRKIGIVNGRIPSCYTISKYTSNNTNAHMVCLSYLFLALNKSRKVVPLKENFLVH